MAPCFLLGHVRGLDLGGFLQAAEELRVFNTLLDSGVLVTTLSWQPFMHTSLPPPSYNRSCRLAGFRLVPQMAPQGLLWCDVPRAVRPTTGLNAPKAWVTGVANLPRFNRCTYTTGRLDLNILTSLESELHDHTPISPRTVAHPSTNQGRCCLTSVIERELVFQHRHRVVNELYSMYVL